MEKCPHDFPHPMDNGLSCCKIPLKANDTSLGVAEDCDGGKLKIDSSPGCCMAGLKVPCPDQSIGCNNAGTGRS